MRHNKLYKNFTVVGIVLVTLLAFVTGAQAELSDATAREQFEFNKCDSKFTSFLKADERFKVECRRAGLGSKDSCQELIKRCEDPEKAKRSSRCAKFSSVESYKNAKEKLKAALDQEEKAKKDLEIKQKEIQAIEDQVISLAAQRDAADQKLRENLSKIGTEAAQKLQEANDKLVTLETQTDTNYHAIKAKSFELRKIILDKKNECRAKAKDFKERFINNKRARRRAGRHATSSLSRLLSHGNKTLNDRADRLARTIFISCTAFYGKNGPTAFGEQIRLQKDMLNQEREILRDKGRRIEKQRQAIIAQRRAVENQLNGQRRDMLKQAQNEVLRISAEAQLLKKRRSSLQIQMATGSVSYLQAQREKLKRQNEFSAEFAGNTERDLEDKQEAYMKVLEHYQKRLTTARAYDSAGDLCEEKSQISEVLREASSSSIGGDISSLEDFDLQDQDPKDGDSVVQGPISSPSTVTPDPAGEAVSRDEVDLAPAFPIQSGSGPF